MLTLVLSLLIVTSFANAKPHTHRPPHPTTMTTTTTTTPAPTSFSIQNYFRTQFDKGDLDHDGRQSFQEFERVWAQNDLNGDHSVTLDEYVAVTHYSRFFVTELFKIFDRDHNNEITIEEVPHRFQDYDTDADGFISEQEYVDEAMKIAKMVATDIGPNVIIG